MLKIGSVIKLNGKNGTVLTVGTDEVLVLKEGTKQPEWMKLDYLRIFNKGI